MGEPMFSEHQRRFEHDGRVYLIRDRIETKRIVHVEYGVKSGDEIVWKPTYEGALFTDMEPFEEDA